MGKRIILITIFFLSYFISSLSYAQTVEKIAYINSVELLESMPQKTRASKRINELNKKYKDELKIMQEDYNKKYSDFISYQNSMAESIKLRRMQELYELEKNINNFMKIAQDDITSQEQQLIEPLKQKLKDAINAVGIEQGFTCIYDLANPSIAFVTPSATDANPLIKKKLSENR